MRLEITTRNYTMRGNFKDILEKKILSLIHISEPTRH